MQQILAVLCLILPYDLSVEYMNNPIGIDTPKPRLSWKSQAVDADAKNLTQTAYEILVASSPEKLANNEGDLWSTGKVVTDQSLNIEYAGKPLTTSQRCYWKVRVWDNLSKEPSKWSEPGFWIMGVMNPNDWKAKWVSLPEELRPDYDMNGAKWIWAGDADDIWKAAPGDRYFRKEFNVPEGVKYDRVVLAITADDRYEVDINGKRATQTWGHFNDWSWLRFIDVAEHLKPGKNEIIVKVNNKEPGPTGLLVKLDTEQNGKPVATFLLSDADWNASASRGGEWKPVKVVGDIDCEPWKKIKRYTNPVPYAFERNFDIAAGKTIKNATLHITGLGFYEASLNGRVGNKVLDPVPTQYDQRVLYSTYDVSKQVKNGDNRFRIELGHGWYDVRTVAVWNYDNAPWRNFPRFLAQLEIEFADGSKEYVISDESWQNAPSFMVSHCIRQGVVVEAKDSSMLPPIKNTIVVPAPKGVLSAESMPGSVITAELKPVSVKETKPGVYTVDFGQNIAGWVRLNFTGQSINPDLPPVKLRYGERIHEDGSLDIHPIDQHFRHGLHAFQEDVILGGGTGMTTFEPKYIYHGFQYVEITGYPTKLTADDLVACTINTDFKQAGHFECSNELFNKIQQATLWAYRGNYANGVPTDCPHREKNGWTGDAHLAAEQAQFNWENTAGYEKWIQDLLDEQRPDGNLPGIVPTSGWGYAWGNGPAWDSAIVLIPWYLYQYKGDKRILEEAYDGMKKYVDYLTTREKPNGLIDHGLGDWVFAKTQTPTIVTSSVYYYLDALTVAKTAQILGKEDDYVTYGRLSHKIARSFLRELVKEDGTIGNGSITSQAFPLYYGIIPLDIAVEDMNDRNAMKKAIDDQSELLNKCGQKLLEAVEKADKHPDVGILGAKVLFRVLGEHGKTDLAIEILNQKTRPSYGDWFERGATTLWEDWRDGDSRNHIMFGDVSAWFYNYLAGIETVHSKAFQDFIICPGGFLNGAFPKEIDWVKADFDSPYGLIKVDWKREGKTITMHVSVPVNTTATIITDLATGEMKSFGSGDYTIELQEP